MCRFAILTVTAMLLIVFCLPILGIGIGINATRSAIPGIYLHLPIRLVGLPGVFTPSHRGQLIGFIFPHADWATKRGYIEPEQIGIKAVGAFPGAHLFVDNRRIYACTSAKRIHCRYLGTCQRWDSHHRRIACQHWSDYRIPKQHYYLTSRRIKNSFDSRYFGLVSLPHLRYRLWLLFTF